MPTGNLSGEGKKLWEEVYNKALKGSCKNDKECAARTAWSAVKGAGWSKDDEGNWHKKAVLTEFSMRIEKAAYDKATNERRWRMVASDTEEDLFEDEMSIELFNDFVGRINRKEKPPEEYCSSFWSGGEPYVSVSHYPDLDGDGVPGLSEATYIDGTYLKAKGVFLDTPLGRKCFEAVCEDMYGTKSTAPSNKIRVSIAFLDYAHKHKSNGVIFERTEDNWYCLECLREMLEGKSAGKIFLKGHLIHYALTRVPVNERTELEVEKSMAEKSITRQMDAESIVGEEEAERLEEAASLIGKSQSALVIRSDSKKDEKDDGVEEEEENKESGKDKKKEEKSDVVVEESTVLDEQPQEIVPEQPDIVSVIRSVVSDEISKFQISISEQKSEHPLDSIYRTLCEKYDEIIASDVSPDERLKSLQTPFNEFAQQVIDVVKSTPVAQQEPEEPAPDGDIVSAISKALAPLSAELEMLRTKLDSITTVPTTAVPQRRSIQVQPNYVPPEAPIVQTKKSVTPSLRALVERTTR